MTTHPAPEVINHIYHIQVKHRGEENYQSSRASAYRAGLRLRTFAAAALISARAWMIGSGITSLAPPILQRVAWGTCMLLPHRSICEAASNEPWHLHS